jgi:hypothetical protein
MKKQVIAAWSVIFFGVAGALVFSTTRTSEPTSKVESEIQHGPVVSVPDDLNVREPAVQVTAEPKPTLSKSALVDKLSKSGSPVDAFTAWKLLSDCVNARRHETESAQEPNPSAQAKTVSPAVACQDISPGQISSRLELLNIAALAGVHEAAMRFANEGPDGNGFSASGQFDTNDPSNAEWVRRTRAQIEAGVKTGDRWSFMVMSNQYENGDGGVERDMGKALAYWVAMVEFEKATTGKAPNSSENIINRLKRTLTPEQVDAAMKFGQQLAISAQTAR